VIAPTRFGTIARVSTPQGGIFALGTSAHAYLEFDVSAGREGRAMVAAISSLREPRTTMGGVNLVAGFRPELWRDAVPDDASAGLAGFNDDLVGPDGSRCRPPSTTLCSGFQGAPMT